MLQPLHEWAVCIKHKRNLLSSAIVRGRGQLLNHDMILRHNKY